MVVVTITDQRIGHKMVNITVKLFVYLQSPMYKKHSCSEPERLHRMGASIKKNV